MPAGLERVGIFVDGGNVFHPMRDKGETINYAGFMNWLHEGRRVKFAGYFNTTVPYENKEAFYEHLKLVGFNMFLKKATLKDSGYKQEGIDVYIAVKAMKAMAQFDTFILVSGDYDFSPLVHEMQNSGKNVEIVSWKSTMHPYYTKYTHKYIDAFLSWDGKVKEYYKKKEEKK